MNASFSTDETPGLSVLRSMTARDQEWFQPERGRYAFGPRCTSECLLAKGSAGQIRSRPATFYAKVPTGLFPARAIGSR